MLRPMGVSKPPVSKFGHFYDEHLRKRVPLFAAGLAGLLVVLYWLGLLRERDGGIALASLVIAYSCVYGVAKLLEAHSNRALTLIVVALGLLTAALSFAPVMKTLLPGAPAAHGLLQAPGDKLELPPDLHGPVRLFFHAKLAGQGASEATVALDMDGQGDVEGHLSRTLTRARVGRRGNTTVVREHNGQYVDAYLSPKVHSLSLTRIDGTLTGPLEVSVFRDPLSLWPEIGLAIVLILLSAALAARMEARLSSVGGLACALTFGILVSRMVTPDEAMGAEFGALFVSVMAAGLLAAVSVGLLQKVVRA
jgi:hypothetical protein